MEILLKKRPGGLEPASDEAYKYLSYIGAGETIVADVRDPRRRSTDQHRFAFAMMNQMFQAQEYFPKFDQFRYALLIKMGYCDEYPLRDGSIVRIPHSLAYGKMEPAEFGQLVEDILAQAVEMGFERLELLAYTRSEIPSVY